MKKPHSRRPFIFVNMAMTADGKIATANRTVHSFGSARDLRHLYELRATADAILSGARTVEISESTMGNGGEKFRCQRLQNSLAEFPLRLIATGSGSLDPRAKIFQNRFSPIIVLTTRRIADKKLMLLRTVADEVKIFGETEIDFVAALGWLRSEKKVKRLLCEGGGELNDALFRARLVDEIHLTICPKIFGGRTAPTIADGSGVSKLAAAGKLKLRSARHFRGELFTVFSWAEKGCQHKNFSTLPLIGR
jgi:riboflavin-specific deaminase-like protein